jgi:hypothetical protein
MPWHEGRVTKIDPPWILVQYDRRDGVPYGPPEAMLADLIKPVIDD